MKILILNWRDPKHPLAGGAEISLFEHAKYWQKQNNEVVWFASQFPDSSNTEVIDGVQIIRKGSHYTVHVWAFIYSVTKRYFKPDIIIDSFHFIPYLTPLYQNKKKIIGLINEVAGELWFDNIIAPFSWIGYIVESSLIKIYKNNLFITGSDSAKKELLLVGLRDENITVVHHGFHLHPVKKNIRKEKKPTILYLGRITNDKGIKDVLSVIAPIKEQIEDCVLWIAGKEEKNGTLQELLNQQSNKTRKSIKYWGFVNEKEKFELLRKATILLHLSKKEGWGLTVIEAASQGTPTVGYNVAGLQDSVQNKKTGILVEPGNITSLQENIVSLLRDTTYYSKLSENALKRSKQFTWSKSVKKSWDVIQYVYAENNKK